MNILRTCHPNISLHLLMVHCMLPFPQLTETLLIYLVTKTQFNTKIILKLIYYLKLQENSY